MDTISKIELMLSYKPPVNELDGLLITLLHTESLDAITKLIKAGVAVDITQYLQIILNLHSSSIYDKKNNNNMDNILQIFKDNKIKIGIKQIKQFNLNDIKFLNKLGIEFEESIKGFSLLNNLTELIDKKESDKINYLLKLFFFC